MGMNRVIPVVAALAGVLAASPGGAEADRSAQKDPGVVSCANLVYGQDKTSVCFSDKFLAQIEKDTHVTTERRFQSVKLESGELYDYPFAIMTGQGTFKLTAAQRENMQNYLVHGGFIIASAGCSSKKWNASFRSEIRKVFPDLEMSSLGADHPVFHTVYDIKSSRYKKGSRKLPHLEGLEIEGKTVLIWSLDGLNDTASVGGDCCCCGSNEIKLAKKLNVNILAYALTH